MHQDCSFLTFDQIPDYSTIIYRRIDLETSKNAFGDSTNIPGEYSSTLLEIIPLEGDRYQLRLVAGTLKPFHKTYKYKVQSHRPVEAIKLLSRSKGKMVKGVPIE